MGTTGVTRSLVLLSPKGGAGKTVLSASLATMLGALGEKVLLVDCDAATNGLTLFYLDKVISLRDDHSDIQVGRRTGTFEPSDNLVSIVESVAEGVDLAPATYVLRQTENVEPSEFRIRLESMLRNVRDRYDFVILDAQAGTDLFAAEAINLAEDVVIVSEYDPISAEGVERLKQIFGRDLDPSRTWILFNKILPEFSSELASFLSIMKVLPPVPWDADVLRAFARRRLPIEPSRGNPYTLAVLKILEALYPSRLEGPLAKWTHSRIGSVQHEIKASLDSVESELERARDALASVTQRRVTFWEAIRAAFSRIAVNGEPLSETERDRMLVNLEREIDRLRANHEKLEILAEATPEELLRRRADVDRLLRREP